VHLPVEFSIGCCVSNNLLVEIFNSGLASSEGLNCFVDIGNKGVKVVLVFLGNLIVLSLIVSEPGDDFLFVEIEAEGVVLDVHPFGGALNGEAEGVWVFSEGESLESEHRNDVGGSWVELVSQESLDLWDDVLDVGAMEVGVVDHVLDDFSVPASIDLLSGLDEWAERDPVVLVKRLDLELKVLEGSLPVAHQEVVLSLESLRPVLDRVRVKDQDDLIVFGLTGSVFDFNGFCSC